MANFLGSLDALIKAHASCRILLLSGRLESTRSAGTDKIFGILLDDVNTGETGATEVKAASVDRKGAFKAQALYTKTGTITVASLEEALRDKGIFLEGGPASPAALATGKK